MLCCGADTETTTQIPRMTAPAPHHSPPLAPPRTLIGRPGPSLASHWSIRRPHRPGWRGYLGWLDWLWPARTHPFAHPILGAQSPGPSLAHWPRHIPGHPHPMSVCSGD